MSRNRKQDNPIKGHPLTIQRRLILDMLRDAEGHVDAKELLHRAIAKDKSISQATIYRSLNLFKEFGLIDEMRLDGLRCYYEIKQSAEHQYLICRGCGKILEFNDSHFQELIESVQQDHCFRVTKVELYLYGYCTNCREKNNSKHVSSGAKKEKDKQEPD